MRRVVVTGMGMLTPLGCGVETTWRRLLDGQSGAKHIDTFDVSDISCKVACVVPRGDGSKAISHLSHRVGSAIAIAAEPAEADPRDAVRSARVVRCNRLDRILNGLGQHVPSSRGTRRGR